MTGSETEVSTLGPARSGDSPARADPIDYARSDTALAARDDELWLGLPLTAWVKILTVTALFVALFWPNLRRLWLKTAPFIGEPNWGHAIGVPLIGLWYLFTHREELSKAKIRPLLSFKFTRNRLVSLGVMFAAALVSYFVVPPIIPSAEPYLQVIGVALAAWGALVLLGDWGLGTLIFGLLVFGYGIWPGQNDFVKDFGMVLTLFGVVLFLCGWRVMSIAWFPIAFLVCAIPWPGLVYSKIASPLQFLAAKVAVGVLGLTGVVSAQVGTKIQISGFEGQVRTLNVAEACAGLRSLMTFISVATAFAFLSARPLWQKIIITLSAIPIAISCNVMRVTGQGLLDHYVSEKLAEGFAHQFVGLVMLLPAIALILMVGWILDHLFIEVAEDDSTGAVVAAKPKATELVIEVPRRKPTTTGTPIDAAAVPAAPTVATPSLAIKHETAEARVLPAEPTIAPPPLPKVAETTAPTSPAKPPPARAMTTAAPKTVRAPSRGPAAESKSAPSMPSPKAAAAAMAKATPAAPVTPKPIATPQTSRPQPPAAPAVAPAARTAPAPAMSKPASSQPTAPTAPAAAPKASTAAITPMRHVASASKPPAAPAVGAGPNVNAPQAPVDPSARKPGSRKTLSPYSFVPPPPPNSVLRSPKAKPTPATPEPPAPASKSTEEKP